MLPLLLLGNGDDAVLPDAESVVDSVKSGFPSGKVTLSGTVSVRRIRGKALNTLGFTLDCLFRTSSARARCVFTDSLGRDETQVIVNASNSGNPDVEIIKGGLVDADGLLKDTGLACEDLVMPFIWWRDVEVIGVEKVRGRDCYILEFRGPAGGRYTRVRASIDKAIFIILKASFFADNMALEKELVVKSFKKIDERWMIKDIEVRQAGSTVKTVIIVDDMAGGDSAE